jgi:hypothetical protein
MSYLSIAPMGTFRPEHELLACSLMIGGALWLVGWMIFFIVITINDIRKGTGK